MITVGSLFSGIGGIELGLERTGGFRTVWHCEIDAYASAVLKKHWPNVPNLGDITKVDWNEVEKPDMLCGGFPCQDISVAGKGKGIKEGTRSGLWFEYARAIRSLRPSLALIENVPMLAKRGLDIVLADLASLGYDAEWINLSASDVGAWHKRERIFIIAYNNCIRRGTGEETSCKRAETSVCSEKSIAYPSSQRCDSRGNCGEGRPILPVEKREVAQEGKERDRRLARAGENGSNVQNPLGNGTNEGDRQENPPRASGERHEDDVGLPSEGYVSDSTIKGLERCIRESLQGHINRFASHNRRKEGIWSAEPNVGRVVYGVPSRVDRIKCLGNAVVPQVAEVIGEMILEELSKQGAK